MAGVPQSKRFIVLPPPTVQPEPSGSKTQLLWSSRLMKFPAEIAAVHGHGRLTSAAKKASGHDSVQWRAPRALPLLKRSTADGALLVDAKGLTLAQVRAQVNAQAPAGAKVVEEKWYQLERPAQPQGLQSTMLSAPKVSASRSMQVSVRVVLDDGGRTPVPDVDVTILIDAQKNIGVNGKTGRKGLLTFTLNRSTARVDAIMVDPLHSGWPVKLDALDLSAGDLLISVPPIDPGQADARGQVYGKPKAGHGQGVKVAVVDTGCGPHARLKVAVGRNTTAGESPRRWRDEHGHGTHVAGVIAASAKGSSWRHGEANAVQLHAYRVFEAGSGDPRASNFAIREAIVRAATDGCDLINLSLGDWEEDEAIRSAIELAWSMGCVCVAATGNDGKAQICYPAAYPNVVAVSAIGLASSWPEGASLGWTKGKDGKVSLGGVLPFLASFSNHGKGVTLAAPGVGIVSTIFDDRWGVMSGTSMATPIATGVLARRLATDAQVLKMPRDKKRSQAIVALARSYAQDIGLPTTMQGAGLAR